MGRKRDRENSAIARHSLPFFFNRIFQKEKRTNKTAKFDRIKIVCTTFLKSLSLFDWATFSLVCLMTHKKKNNNTAKAEQTN